MQPSNQPLSRGELMAEARELVRAIAEDTAHLDSKLPMFPQTRVTLRGRVTKNRARLQVLRDELGEEIVNTIPDPIDLPRFQSVTPGVVV